MGRSVEGLTTSMTLRKKDQKKRQGLPLLTLITRFQELAQGVQKSTLSWLQE